LRRGRIGAAKEQAKVRAMRERGPDLLPIDDEVVAAILRAGAERGDVGAGAGLGVSLAPDLIARENRRQVALLHLLCAPLHQSGSRDVQADRIDGAGPADSIHLLFVDVLFDEARAAS